jgi:hypothetical protein
MGILVAFAPLIAFALMDRLLGPTEGLIACAGNFGRTVDTRNRDLRFIRRAGPLRRARGPDLVDRKRSTSRRRRAPSASAQY